MIAQIDAMRRAHNSAMAEAIQAINDLGELVALPNAHELEAQYLHAIDIVNRATDKAIHRMVNQGEDETNGQTVINVAGDYVKQEISGDVTGDVTGVNK